MPDSTDAPSSTPAPSAPVFGEEVIARASTEYRVKRYIMVFILAGAGAWFGYDGFYGWPAENAKIQKLDDEIVVARQTQGNEEAVKKLEFDKSKLTKRTDMDLLFQKTLFFTLPPLGFAVLAFALYNSRGRYRLYNNILEVPGHPPVPLDAIIAIDKTYWDRKGIALINYELPNGAADKLRLDDFIYQRPPTDEIYKRIEEYTGTAEPPAETPAETPAPDATA